MRLQVFNAEKKFTKNGKPYAKFKDASGTWYSAFENPEIGSLPDGSFVEGEVEQKGNYHNFTGTPVAQGESQASFQPMTKRDWESKEYRQTASIAMQNAHNVAANLFHGQGDTEAFYEATNKIFRRNLKAYEQAMSMEANRNVQKAVADLPPPPEVSLDDIPF